MFRNIGEWIFDNPEWMLGIFVVVIVALGIASFVADRASPKFELSKTEWVCTSHRETLSTIFVPIGKTLTPQVVEKAICDNYARRRL